ncbi:MAG: glycosyltransferase family 4 protein [Gemmataceae bacterium]|nr:glycosyltransferase family 4 protein [Gemmataceae bacterium]
MSSRKVRRSILAVTSQIPWPLNSGGHLRSFHLLRALATEFSVRLVTTATAVQTDAVAALEEHGIQVCPAWVSERSRWREILRAASALVVGEPYVVYRRHNRPEIRQVFEKELQNHTPDLLYLDHLDSALFCDEQSSVPIVIDLHNVYSLLVERTAEERRALARYYLRREARLLKQMEAAAMKKADGVFAVSDEEAKYFRELGGRQVHTVPNGVDCQRYEHLPRGERTGPPVIVYIGAMSWAPNARAACFLAEEVLPKVRARLQDARLRIVGRDPPEEVRRLADQPGVEVTGTVPDVVPHLAEAHLLAVPLESGGGTRLKILEAFAAGLPVVSTPVGCEGLQVQHDEQLLIAGRNEFADGVVAVLGDPDRANQLARQAHTFVKDRYDWRSIGHGACNHLHRLLDNVRTGRAD